MNADEFLARHQRMHAAELRRQNIERWTLRAAWVLAVVIVLGVVWRTVS